MTEKTVNLIICAKNHLHDQTIPCLDSIFQNTFYPYMLILVDDGSTDGTAHYFSTIGGARVIRLPNSKGAAIARNEALARYQFADLTVFLDNDTRLPLRWLTILAEESQKQHVGIVGGIPTHRYQVITMQQSQDGLIDWYEVSSACMAITRECLEAVGLLDEELYNGGEDTDFCFRAKLAGFRVVFTPRLVVTHYAGTTRGRTAKDRRRIYKSTLRLRKKYKDYQSVLPLPVLAPYVRKASSQCQNQ